MFLINCVRVCEGVVRGRGREELVSIFPPYIQSSYIVYLCLVNRSKRAILILLLKLEVRIRLAQEVLELGTGNEITACDTQ